MGSIDALRGFDPYIETGVLVRPRFRVPRSSKVSTAEKLVPSSYYGVVRVTGRLLRKDYARETVLETLQAKYPRTTRVYQGGRYWVGYYYE